MTLAVNNINYYSAFPIAGQIIGATTIISNVAKTIFFGLGAVLAYPTNKANYHNYKESCRTSCIYIGIGLVRALPIVGGAVLYATEVAPANRFKYNKDSKGRVVRTQLELRKPNTERTREVMAVHLIRAVPLYGQALSAAYAITNLFMICFCLIGKVTFLRNNREELMQCTIKTNDQLLELGMNLIGLFLPVIGGLTLYMAQAYPNKTYEVHGKYLFSTIRQALEH